MLADSKRDNFFQNNHKQSGGGGGDGAISTSHTSQMFNESYRFDMGILRPKTCAMFNKRDAYAWGIAPEQMQHIRQFKEHPNMQ